MAYLPTDRATARRRWTEEGEIKEFGAIESGLSAELESLLSDIPRTCNAITELERLSAASNSNQICSVNVEVTDCVRAQLSEDLIMFWRWQALVIAYRAVPWKYLEFP